MQPSPVVVQVPSIERHTLPAEVPGKNESYSAGVSWPAVIGGGFVFGALSLVLLVWELVWGFPPFLRGQT